MRKIYHCDSWTLTIGVGWQMEVIRIVLSRIRIFTGLVFWNHDMVVLFQNILHLLRTVVSLLPTRLLEYHLVFIVLLV